MTWTSEAYYHAFTSSKARSLAQDPSYGTDVHCLSKPQAVGLSCLTDIGVATLAKGAHAHPFTIPPSKAPQQTQQNQRPSLGCWKLALRMPANLCSGSARLLHAQGSPTWSTYPWTGCSTALRRPR